MMITVLLAKKIRKPVKIELDNEECMGTVKRRHIERTRGMMGCTADGQLTVAKFDHLIDNGGYGFKDDVGFFLCGHVGESFYMVTMRFTELIRIYSLRAVCAGWEIVRSAPVLNDCVINSLKK